MRKYLISAFLLLLFAVATGVLVLGGNGHIPLGKFSSWSQATVEARTKRINQELKNLRDHRWAGGYYQGDGLGLNVNLSLAPKSGFAFTWYGCLGLYDLNYGRVVERDGKINLIFTFPNDRNGLQGVASGLVPVAWGERHYLIPTDAFVDFANTINAGFEPRNSPHGRFLLRKGDEAKKVSGVPNLPEPYSQYLLKKAVKAEIASVKGSRVEESTRITTVVLNVGSSQGVKEGMEFHLYSPSNLYEWARVTKVGASDSEAEISQNEGSGRRGRPSVGWKLSTSAQRD